MLLLAASTAALAAAATATAQDNKATGLALEEVIVTARKSEERLQNVPVAVTALSGAALEEKSINSFQDLQYAVPSLSFSQSVSRNNNRIAIRGQGTSYGSQYAAVEVNFADVPITGGSSASMPFYDIQSVQVLKGPQGVAFGRNSSGGAVLVTPVRPQFEFDSYVSGLLGNFDAYEIEGMINVPLVSDKLAVRASVHMERRDGWTKNVLLGTRLDDKHLDAARVSVLYEPTDWLENQTVISYQDLDVSGSANHMVAYNPAGQVGRLYRAPLYNGPYNIGQEAALAQSLGRDKIRSDFDGYNNVESLFVANTSIFRVNDALRVKNIFGMQRTGGKTAGTDMDGTPLSLITLGRNEEMGDAPTTQILTNELQLQGEQMDGRVKWLTGLFVSKQKPVEDGKPSSSIQLEGIPITAATTPNLTYIETELSSFAPFAQVTLPLDFVSERLSFTVGARHTTDKLDEKTLVRVGPNQVCSSDPECDYIVRDGEWKGWNYSATFDYQIDDDTLVYVAHRRGFKGGGLNRVTAPPEFALVKPEYVRDVEAGLKTDWMLGSVPMRTNLSIYQQWYTDIVRSQFFFPANGGPAFNLNTNIEEAEIRGGELEQTIIFSDRVELVLGYSHTDAEFTGDTIVPFKHFPEVPMNQFNATALWRLPVPDALGDITLVGTAAYQGKRAGDQNAVSPEAFQDGYTLYDARVDWRRVFGQKIDASLWVKNLTDEEYILAGGDFLPSTTLGFIQGLYGEPRTYGVELKYSFGK
jgi:iron complex outermembrane recepter protein